MKFTFLLTTLFLIACTPNKRARSYGGTEIITIPKNNVFINATWKESNLWYLTKDTIENKFYLREKSSFGIMEGKIIFQYDEKSIKDIK